MKKLVPAILFLTLFFTACQSDQDRMNEFAGNYEVTMEIPDAGDEMKKAKKDVKKEIEQAKEQIREEIAKAKDDIEAEMGEDNNFGKAISHFVEGMGKFAEGMTELAEEVSHLGIDLGSDILGSMHFNAEFRGDGEVVFGRSSKGLRINSGRDLRWEIRDGKFYLWNDSKDEEPKPYEMKKISDTEWDLVGKEVIFHLQKSE